MNLYLLINMLVMLFPLLLSFDRRVVFYRQWGAAFKAIVPVAAVFISQDIYATASGHWSFSPIYAGTLKILGLPPGEWLFFLTVPFASIFVYACVRGYQREKTLTVTADSALVLAGLALTGAILFRSRAYSCWVMLLLALAFLVLRFLQPRLLRSLNFWTAIGISYLAFALVNGVLTAVPVVSYSPAENWGLRIGSIPLEDFFYSFSLLSLNFSLFRIFLDGKTGPSPREGSYTGPEGRGSTETPRAPYRFMERKDI